MELFARPSAGRAFGALLITCALVIGGCSGDRATIAKPSDTTVAGSATTAAGVSTPSTLPPGTTLVATATGPNVAVYDGPSNTAAPKVTLDNPNENGAPLVFLVVSQQGGWINVNLPVRPNGSTGWIESSSVSLAPNPYKVVVQLGAHKLQLYENATKLVLDVPIGVGTQDTPTPGGVFYIKELLQPPNPNGAYGPYAYGLSGFSEKDELANFAGGTGVIGIHGTNEPGLVGTNVSHGCIRLRNDDILKLVKILPLGTPVDIQA
jgi:lipoprotein-anchoring transpeptidase ErfK/SrfK